MRELKQSLQLLREHFKKAEAEQNKISGILKEILASWTLPDFTALVEFVTVKKGQVFIKTKNKTVANELWLRRVEILKLIQQKQPSVKEIKIY